MLNIMKRLIIEDDGQGMTEYALVLGVIAVGAIATMTLFRDQVEALWTNITSIMTNAVGSTTPTP